jgi:hypothetical protein
MRIVIPTYLVVKPSSFPANDGNGFARLATPELVCRHSKNDSLHKGQNAKKFLPVIELLSPDFNKFYAGGG